MKKLAKLLALVLALTLILTFAACKGKEEVKAPAAAPGTEANVPATEAPASEAPATEAPATEAPVTEAPATEAPATEAPVTEAPVPATEAPNVDPGSFEIDPALVGVWESELDLSEILEISGADADPESLEMFSLLTGNSPLRVHFEFTADGVTTFSLDKESVHEMYEAIFENLPTILPGLYGVSQEEFEQLLQAQNMSMDDYIELMRSQLKEEDMMSSIGEATTTGYYTVSGNRLYVSDDPNQLGAESNYMVFSISGSKLTLEEFVGGDSEALEGIKQLLPWEFTRIG